MGAGRVGRLSFFFWSSFGVLTAWWSWACSLGANVPPVPWSFQLGLLSPCSPLTWLGSQVGAQKQFSAGLFPSHFTQSALQLCSDCSWENSDLKDVLAQSQAESSERAGCELQSSPDCCSTERWWLIRAVSECHSSWLSWAGQGKPASLTRSGFFCHWNTCEFACKKKAWQSGMWCFLGWSSSNAACQNNRSRSWGGDSVHDQSSKKAKASFGVRYTHYYRLVFQ